MDAARYYVALFVVVAMPSGFLFWFLIHPWTGFWRRLGHAWTYWIVGTLMAALMVGLVLIRHRLLAVEYGTRWPLIALAVVLFAAASVIALKRRKLLTTKVLVGLPQLAPDRHPGRLLTEGIYRRIRHPRYVEIILALAAYALFTNYLAMYLLVLASPAAVYLIVLLEEKELRQRFGAEYEAYCRRVPRFIPRLGGSGGA